MAADTPVRVVNGWVVCKPDDPVSLKAVLPGARDLVVDGEDVLAVPHTLDATKVMRNLGIPAPSPINFGWEYPGRYKPYNHQKETAEFLTTNHRGFVLSEMGTGKSASALWAAEYLMQQGLVRRVLIIAPKSCLRVVWANEVFNIAMHRTVVVLEGSKGRSRCQALYASSAEYIAVNPDGLAGINDLVKVDPLLDLIIVDEAAAFRNAGTKRYKMLKAMIPARARLWLMTGTPCPSAPTDAWALIRLVRPENVPPYFTSFQRMTMNQVSAFKWVPKPDAYEQVYTAMQPAIRFLKKDCIDLPPIVYQDRECALTVSQQKAYDAMKRHLAATHEGAQITAANAAVKLTKLLQICAGVVYDDTGTVAQLDSTPRIEALKEIIEECDRKVIVWAPFKSVLYKLQEMLLAHLGEDTCEVVCGDTGDRERARIFSEFQVTENKLKVLIAHPGTAAHGLTLTAANTGIWYGPFFSAEMYLQANERYNRPGQKHNMSVIHLGATPIEWAVYGVLRDKTNRQQKILDMYTKEIT